VAFAVGCQGHTACALWPVATPREEKRAITLVQPRSLAYR